MAIWTLYANFCQEFRIIYTFLIFYFIKGNSTYSFSINFSTFPFVLAWAKLYACKNQF